MKMKCKVTKDTDCRYYKEYNTKQCKQCDDECLICNDAVSMRCLIGIHFFIFQSSRNCTKCIHLIVYHQKNELECVRECPISHYLENNTCHQCHSACEDYGYRDLKLECYQCLFSVVSDQAIN